MNTEPNTQAYLDANPELIERVLYAELPSGAVFDIAPAVAAVKKYGPFPPPPGYDSDEQFEHAIDGSLTSEWIDGRVRARGWNVE